MLQAQNIHSVTNCFTIDTSLDWLKGGYCMAEWDAECYYVSNFCLQFDFDLFWEMILLIKRCISLVGMAEHFANIHAVYITWHMCKISRLCLYKHSLEQ